MAEVYHVTKRGETRKCEAEAGNCPLGGQHFDTNEEANAYRDGLMAGQTYADVTKKSAKPKIPVETYRHPQGKVATVRNGILTVTKDGKLTKSSATIDKLRDGHGRWVRDDSIAAPETQRPQGRPAPKLPKDSEGVKNPDKRELTPREKAIVQKGYPVNTKLDPSKSLELEDRPGRPTHMSRAVLPTQTRFNPHTAGEGNEYVEIWNKGGETSYLVVEGETRGGRKTHRMIAGWESEKDSAIGDTFPLEHDQTQARIGEGTWKIIGAFRGGTDRAATGEIPDRSIPLYTYK